MTEKEIRRRLRKNLSPGRFRHTLNVARGAEKLARRHGADPDKARLAGLLHDCGKEWTVSRQAAAVKKWRLPVPEAKFIFECGRLKLLHAYVSAALAEREFGVKDPAVLAAVRAHTLGADKMSLLARILYIADFASSERKGDEIRLVRRLAKKNLDDAFREALRWKLLYVLNDHGPIHPLAVRLWNRWRPM
jgi:predicted HD superfamily hydrolase involved in NAD metabolism